ncbi:Hir2p NDAI_0F00770 [Naumovozyma dairenensis CBS 421]|uniref:Protein HIR n=1 Tax=Naumovozyma dairenensis (strain ATCC 10597 / BCRC 20456 / CBS 421 / NBRC 0211 / NRRL Y-12639) TaxID=1071378 RepID=G0WC85_NAUDC|nr:hypothetical protein NDAI_0F00770 [Naumovozyma dairenensis CBS 421]CCD25396.1 hypothetical protein NDAI_0F00770 [Naumovozyma dairenensis CBS 421]
MRLLKYPLETESKHLTSLTAVDKDNKLIIADDTGHVIVWSQSNLINTAFNKIPIKDLKLDLKFKLPDYDPDWDVTVFNIISCDVDETRDGSLIVATEFRIIIVDHWMDEAKRSFKTLYKCPIKNIITHNHGMEMRSNIMTITDVKLDSVKNILLASLVSLKDNKILLFDSQTWKLLNVIKLDLMQKPITIITTPTTEETVTVMCLDRSILVYQFNKIGNFKLIHSFPQYVQLQPIHYQLSMPPQSNLLPVINSIKGSTSKDITTTVLLDRLNNYKIKTTLVSPSSINSKVLKSSPVIYEKFNQRKNTKIKYNLLATSANKDGSIMVWNTGRMKPLFNAIQISETPINDMEWSKDGYSLFAISNDGILYTFAFQQSDLGDIFQPTTKEKTNEQQVEAKDNIISLAPLPEIKIDQQLLDDTLSNKYELEEEDDDDDNKQKEAGALTTEKGNKKKNAKRKSVSSTSSSSTTTKINSNNTANNKEPMKPDIKITKSNNMEFNPPSYNVPKDLKRKLKPQLQQQTLQSQPPPAAINGKDGSHTPSAKKVKRDLEPIDFLDTNLILPNVSFSRIRLATPKIRLKFTYIPPSPQSQSVLSPMGKSDSSILKLSVLNGSGTEQTPTIITLENTKSQQKLFEKMIPNFVTLTTSGTSFWAISTDTGTIYTYSDTGRTILPPLILGVPISFLEAMGSYLLCLTSLGELYCWDLENRKLKFPMNSIYPILNPSQRYSDDILTRAENVTMCSITRKGVPIVTLSNGNGFIFDEEMGVWCLVSDSWWAFGSQYWNSLSSDNYTNENDKDGKSKNERQGNSSDEMMQVIINEKGSLINFLETKTNDELNRKNKIKLLQKFSKVVLMKEGFENMEEVVTLSHLENKLLVSLKLKENSEFNQLITLYCIKLSELGYLGRLDDILQWIYNGGEGDILGKPRKEILKEILIECAKFRHVQRVTTAYATAIGMINDLF